MSVDISGGSKWISQAHRWGRRTYPLSWLANSRVQYPIDVPEGNDGTVYTGRPDQYGKPSEP